MPGVARREALFRWPFPCAVRLRWPDGPAGSGALRPFRARDVCEQSPLPDSTGRD